jgi:ornithine decarboxylase
MNKFNNIAKKSYRSIGVYNFNHLSTVLKSWKKHINYIKPYYAIKSNPEEKLINYLANQDIIRVGFDCASRNEIKLTNKLSKDIIFANPSKSQDDILYSKNKVKYIVTDSIEDCDNIMKVHNNPQIIIRILSDELNSEIKFNNKFGANIYEADKILDKYKKYIRGYSFHVGSKCHNMDSYVNSIQRIIDINKLDDYIIDIGGGFQNTDQLIELNEKIKRNHLLLRNIEYIAEPGRLFSQSTLDLYTKIISVREKMSEHGVIYNITINDSIYHSFNGKIYDGQVYEPLPQWGNISEPHYKCVIFGNTCDGLDVITECYLPKPKINDIILFKNMGAYSVACTTGNFNGFPSASII